MASPNISTDQTARLVLAMGMPEEWGSVRHRFEDGASQGFQRVDAKLTDYELVFEGDKTQILSLRTFLDARKGSYQVFYFDNPWTAENDIPVYLEGGPVPYRWSDPGRYGVSILVHRTT